MREGTAQLIRREDYTAPAYWIRSVDLTFELDPAKTLVINRMQVERNADQPAQPLRLHGEDITVTRVLVNGDSVSFRHEDGQLVIDTLPDTPFSLEIRNICAPDKNTKLSGLYQSGGGLFTQCEAEGFRRITYFLDRPDVMAVYTVTLRASKAAYPVLLSNGNLVEQGELPNGKHFAKWHDPFPKPSYLFALVAADLVAREQHIRTRSGKDHLLQVYVRRGDLEKTEHAMNSLIASVVWDEARFKLPLDLERFMIVAVGDFNMGAMENKGLNIFNTKFVLATPATATDVDYAGIESVVGHEYFHNWTGNRITCRDWFQLSLKEGLTVFRDQEFSMDMTGSATARAVKRIEDVRQLRQIQFPEDAGSMAHPVRPDSYVEINNFYTATVYEKGAEVVRMMQTLVGRDGFARGMTLYFERFDGQAVTCDDFAQSIADANPDSELARQLPQFKRWYSQAGTPRLASRGRFDAPTRTYTLSLEQHGLPSPGQSEKEPYVIPVAMGLVGRDGRAIPLQLEGEAEASGTERVLVLNQPRNFYTFVNVDVEPVPSLLRGFSAPVVLNDHLADADLLVLLQHDPDPFNRWEAGQRLALNRLLAAIGSDEPLVLDAGFTDALRAVLRHPELDAAFKDLTLTLPSETYLAEQLQVVDPQKIHAARESMKLQLAQALRDDWAWAFEQHQVAGGYSPDAVSAGKRSLANLSLSMLCLASAADGDTVWPGRAFQRFKDAGNMTDRLGALSALTGSHAELAAPALERFHALFKGDALVIDKWFALQATTPEKNGLVFERAKQLLKHPDFSLKNPNRARSLISALCMNNPAAFHRADGAGHAFWADRIVELDGINPQLAARMARVMDRWAALAEPYRTSAHAALQRVAAKADLSNDVREIIGRALQQV
ncbi:aminopeptidase N [Piscinibacter gummiphilus]|uniref:Aminopeptidase N n=1 Tax=Piscinibacter gummiphilus TaxID=946333 RepID=A0A1W6LCB7_9BURK|nr:aminopeptidase N [Piscinibacter gummiphilus]ARN21931.1 aminopeptidase N [Piscinibacter gummiphilus]ATU66617.1 aminopeptidase N [Piscinibacter gummiphilus]GLS93993.1 aminopeptidase N [Piscinibacter gummiphilus]